MRSDAKRAPKRVIQRSRREFRPKESRHDALDEDISDGEISCENGSWRCPEELTSERPAEELIREPPTVRSDMMLALWYTCVAKTVENFEGIPIHKARAFVLDNDAASLDVSQGNRTPSDYVALEGAECAAVGLGWYAGGCPEQSGRGRTVLGLMNVKIACSVNGTAMEWCRCRCGRWERKERRAHWC